MNAAKPTIAECDGALFNENVSRFPAKELAKYASQYVAWSLDGTRILASGSNHEELDREVAAAGLRHGDFVEDYVPGSNEQTVVG